MIDGAGTRQAVPKSDPKLVELANDEHGDGPDERNEPPYPTDGEAIQPQHCSDARNQHGDEECGLGDGDCALHVRIREGVDPDGLVEGAGGVGPDVLGPHQGDERHRPCAFQTSEGLSVVLRVLDHLGNLLDIQFVDVEVQGPDVDGQDHPCQDEGVNHRAAPHPAEQDRLGLGPGPIEHDRLLAGLQAQGYGGCQVRDKDQVENLDRRPHDRQLGHDADEDLQDLGDVHGHDEGHELPDAGVDRPALLHRADDRDEVVIRQDHVRCALGDLGALDAHGDTDVRRLQRRRVVHAVACHGAHEALALQGEDNREFVLGLRTRENTRLGCQLVEIALGQVVAVGAQGVAIKRDFVFGTQDAHVARDRLRGLEVIPRDHHDAHVARVRHVDGVANAVARRVDRRHQAEEGKVFAQEIDFVADRHGAVIVEHALRKGLHRSGCHSQHP
mmetsp:Transcript_10243/g.31962  ORF Transcript_10243/g.31962 Transcript_10243/m.31962 type:complete len:444 (-) Transcript_10243:607-1938(-)